MNNINQQKEPVLVFINKKRVIVNLIFASIWLFFLLNRRDRVTAINPDPYRWWYLYAFMAITIGIPLIVSLLFRIFQKEPEIIITHEGITLNRYGYIPWNHINAVELHGPFSRYGNEGLYKSIMITLTSNYKISIENKTIFARLLWFLKKIPLYPHLSMSTTQLYSLLTSLLSESKNEQKKL